MSSRPFRAAFLLGDDMPNVDRPAPSENHTQSVLFYKNAGWTKASSKKWVKDHDYFTDGLDETDNMFRWRQYDPDDTKFRYVTKVIEEKDKKSSIALVLAYKKGKQMKSPFGKLAGRIESAVQKAAEDVFGYTERAISMPSIYSMVYAKLDEQMQADGVWRALIDVYMNGTEMYAVIGINGLLYKAGLSIAAGGVTLGDLIQVEVDYKPVIQGLSVHRQADGKYRWFAFPAATAVLNRSGEMDTRELFQNFVTRIESGEVPYPFLSFYHVGEQITLGQADFVAAEGYEYLVSGIFADDALSQATRRAIEKEPGYWGISIGYYYMPEAVERVIVADGITIPAYTDGINHELSILAEADASCLFTGIYVQEEGVNRMNKKTLEALKKVAGDDPEAIAIVDDLEEKVDGINTEIEAKDLIRREAEEKSAEIPAPATVPAPETVPSTEAVPVVEPPEETELILDNEGMEKLSQSVAEKMGAVFSKQLEELSILQEERIAILTKTIAELAERIVKLETPLEETVKQAVADLPRNQLKVGYRPTTRQAEQPEKLSTEDVAQATLASIKK